MRRSKLNFLKAHNFLSTLSEAMRKRREASREKILKFRETRKFQQGMNTEVVKQSQETNASKQIQSHWNVFRRGTNSDKVTSEGEHTLQEITVEGAHFTKKELPFSTQDAVETSKESLTPLVSDSVHDDVFIRRRRFGQSDLQERVVSVKNSEIVGVITTEPKKPKEQLEELLIGRIVSNPRDVEAYERLGDYYLENENYIDAKECYRQVLKLSPVNRLVKIKIRRLERVLEKQE